ncbi:MarR family winged helix-turn-helix transcriptional regulator [Roseibium sp. HPY-6]|uniref:MarR family winged helix-turn-helix transcriptional regulator n=1 Tax=Roseibium sp. HPY-6 TaxID=3229852 RepID=UPI00338E7B5C
MHTKGIMEEDDFSLCVLNNARKAARAVSRHYDRLARPIGMTAGQFSVLVAIRQARNASTSELAGRLSMDRTTLVRNIALVERKGLVVSAQARDARSKRYALTGEGEALLEKALPLWRKAQNDVETHLGSEEFLKTINALQRLSKL